MTTIIVTGSAGFIGFHVSQALLRSGYTVIGVDSITPYYDIRLKEARNTLLLQHDNYIFYKEDITNHSAMEKIFQQHTPTIVLNLAAQAGVRYSLVNPSSYIHTNVVGFGSLIELAHIYNIEHFIYASSSSVYGVDATVPFCETDRTDSPASIYAATKQANERIAYAYTHLYAMPTTGLRFFTVYGPYGRPDMAIYLFTKAIFEDRPIQLFNNGDMLRDFTYIDDITSGVIALIQKKPEQKARIYNIGNNTCIPLGDFVQLLERAIGKSAIKEYLPMQKGDVYQTYANIDALHNYVGFTPTTTLEEGIPQFVQWYKEFHALV